ncbi:MAG: hypothetical protein DI570_11910 [Phenylobacterium zucineum]|nr:MAG: hypothetical protein DI570_11910 [Phenylobacterium zucineum]
MDGRRAHWGRLIAATAVTMAGIVVSPHVLPPVDIQENRVLAPPPEAPRSLSDLAAFRKAADAYVADNFPGRAYLIAGLNRVRLALGVSGSTTAIVGRDGWLFSDNGTHLGAARGDPEMTPAALQGWLAGLAGRGEAAARQGATYVVLIAPVKEAVYPDQAPWWFQRAPARPATVLPALARASGAGVVIYPAPELQHQAHWGLKTYSRHDTHWTGLGAYHGYRALMTELNRRGLAEGPRPLEAFQEVRRYERNKPRDLALMLGVASFVDVDYPELGDPAAPSTSTTYLTDKRDWTAPQVVDTGLAGKPVLMMTMDSFSNALLPFLYGHFSRIVLSHGQDGAWRDDLMTRFKPDIVLSEVIENGVPNVMDGSPPPTPDAMVRVEQAVARRERHTVFATPDEGRPPRRMQGTEGPDHLIGGEGPDDIQAGPGDDTVEGRGGPDTIRGGRGRDRLDGGDGADTLSGGRDDDVLRGGRGPDVFNSFVDAGTDEVLDFSIAEGDRVLLDAGTAFTIRQEGPDTVVEMQGARLILRGVRAADLPAGTVRTR